MEQDRDFIIGQGMRALHIAFNIEETFSGARGPFSGSAHRPAGTPGGGRFKTRAGRIHASDTVKAGFSKPLLGDRQKLAGFVHRFISELNAMEQCWVHYRYRDIGQKQRESGQHFLRVYAAQYIALHCKRSRSGTRTEVRKMIAWRMKQEAGELPWNAAYQSESLHASRQAIAETYTAHWNRICDDLERVTELVLFKIGSKVALL